MYLNALKQKKAGRPPLGKSGVKCFGPSKCSHRACTPPLTVFYYVLNLFK